MTSQSFWGINFGRDPKLRAADSDRERVAERIRQSHAEGRLEGILTASDVTRALARASLASPA